MTTAHLSTEFALPPLRLANDEGNGQPILRFVNDLDVIRELSSVKGARIITIETRTEPRLLAKHPETGASNPYRGNVVKLSRVNGMIGWQYASCVNRQRDREDRVADFESLPRKWGQRISGTPFVEHEGSMYLEMKVERSLGYRYEALDGRVLDSAAVEQYLPRRGPTRQGVEREIILRDYALSSIESIKTGGVTFILRRANDNEQNDPSELSEMVGAA